MWWKIKIVGSVFTRQEPHTHHSTQMKLLNAIAAAGIFGLPLVHIIPANAVVRAEIYSGRMAFNNNGEALFCVVLRSRPTEQRCWKSPESSMPMPTKPFGTYETREMSNEERIRWTQWWAENANSQ